MSLTGKIAKRVVLFAAGIAMLAETAGNVYAQSSPEYVIIGRYLVEEKAMLALGIISDMINYKEPRMSTAEILDSADRLTDFDNKLTAKELASYGAFLVSGKSLPKGSILPGFDKRVSTR
ncbi:hypothetical protein HYT25_02990 [Candidatus Pacearchaeota archaeon]|nr:hypothetical protein [Candidatus Pacearchaeota archaeon]